MLQESKRDYTDITTCSTSWWYQFLYVCILTRTVQLINKSMYVLCSVVTDGRTDRHRQTHRHRYFFLFGTLKTNYGEKWSTCYINLHQCFHDCTFCYPRNKIRAYMYILLQQQINSNNMRVTAVSCRLG